MKRLIAIRAAETERAANGKIAAEMFAASLPDYCDAILMDARMPKMDGLEATTAIRALGRADAKRVPIIAMTANAFAGDVQAAKDAGMQAHIAKPVDIAVLHRTLQQVLRGK